MQTFVCLLIVQLFVHSAVTQQSTYKAAVVEYAPRLTAATPVNRLLENVQQYVDYIEQAADQNVQIIVFPEDGLTGWQDINDNTVEELSTEVPNPSQQISPCITQNSNYSKAFKDLSCAAQTHKVYTVVNLIEKEYDNKSGKKIYHNTNVVFDKNGGLIARYRKINLFNEPVFVPGTETATFKTDFGVTFGMFICFDIAFKNPALDVLSDPLVTDVVYSVAWFSELPFWQALATQHGYAKSNRVNLLSSGLDDPALKNGGSGIFLADGRVAQMYISGVRKSALIIQDVPILGTRNTNNSCENNSSPSPRASGIANGVPTDISSFHTSEEDMSNYTFKSLNLNDKIITETICSGEKFCCSFNITVGKKLAAEPNYVYKLAAFNGARAASLTGTVGVRNCGLVACLNESTTTCGGRKTVAPIGVTFESIAVKGTFDAHDAHNQPVSLRFDLKPMTEYTYCAQTANNQVDVSVATTEPQDALLSFGIHGRVFSNDNKPKGPINSATFGKMNIYVVFVISIFIFLLQD